MPFNVNVEDPALVFATLALSSALKYTFGVTSWSKKKKAFKLIGKISQINSYPIKACGGFSLDTADATRLGIRVNGLYDRHWLVVKENGDFLTQRQYPQLATVSTSIKDNQLHISASGMPVLVVPINPSFDRSKVVKCRVWVNHLLGQDCGSEAAQWFSKFLDTEGIRLLFSAPDLAKPQALSKKYPYGNSALPGDQGGFQDECCGFLVANQASLDELNTQLATGVTFRNFRPNLVIDGPEPFEEDNWKELRVGEKVFIRMLEPCLRCVVTTVDPNRGAKREDGEPLKTLSKFRCFEKYGKSPLFGILATADEPGRIKVGDPVYVIRK